MKSSWRKKLLGLVASGAIVASLVPAQALAEAALVLDSTAQDAGPGYSLTVSGLENGDTVKYYQIIEQDVDSYVKATTYDANAQYYTKSDDTYTAVDVANENLFKAGTYYTFRIGTQQWKLTKAVDADGDGIVDGTEDTDFGHIELKNKVETPKNGLWIDELVITSFKEEIDVVNGDLRQLTPDMVNALSTAVTNNAKNDSTLVKGSGTAAEKKFTVANAASGLYMFVAVPAAGDSNYLYKPIFVSADYYNSVSKPEDNTHAINVDSGKKDDHKNIIGVDYPSVTPTPPQNDTVPDAGVFKRSPITIDKKSGTYKQDGSPEDMKQDVSVGDTVEFTITVPIPTYTENYVAPQFYITDTLTDGLQLNEQSISVVVKNGNGEEVANKNEDYRIFSKVGAEAESSANQYYWFKNTETKTSTRNGFVVQFLNDKPGNDVHHDGFLYTVVGAPTATITYTATVTSTDAQQFAQQVNQMDNTAKLTYSKDPNFIPDGYYTDTTDPNDPDKKIPDDNFDTDDPSDETRTMTVSDPENPGGSKSVTEDTGLLVDKTRHYTFDIDADVLGRDQSGDKKPGEGGAPGTEPLDEEDHDRTSEIRKIWVDSNGETIQSRESSLVTKAGANKEGSEYEGKEGEYGWLEGATFRLTKTHEHVTTGATNLETDFKELSEQKVIKFDSTTHIKSDSGTDPTSDGKGYIAMKGLDAGIYELKEIGAPLGYAFNPIITYTIKITPNYVMELGATDAKPDQTTYDGKGSGDDLILKSYTVEIKTQKLDDNMNIIDGEFVTTTTTYTIADDTTSADAEGTLHNPISFLATADVKDQNDPTKNTVNEGDLAVPENPATVTGSIVDVTTTTSNNAGTAMVMNKKLGILPATGGSGILFYLGVGGGIAALALVLMNKTKKAAMRTA